MNDSTRGDLAHNLSGIASRIEAVTQLLQCIREEVGEGHGLAVDTVVSRLLLYAEAIRAAGGGHAISWRLSDELALAGIDPNRDDLIDGYVLCHLGGLVAAVRPLSWRYQESDERSERLIGEAISECLHWVEVARHQLELKPSGPLPRAA